MSRVEIITGRGERRRWSAEEKARLVAETYEPGAVITHVARRHGVAESCLHLWRKQLGSSGAGTIVPNELIPVTLDATPIPAPEAPPPPAPARALITFPDGTRLDVGTDYPAPALKALIAAVTGRR